jgi:hypothetical protein
MIGRSPFDGYHTRLLKRKPNVCGAIADVKLLYPVYSLHKNECGCLDSLIVQKDWRAGGGSCSRSRNFGVKVVTILF